MKSIQSPQNKDQNRKAERPSLVSITLVVGFCGGIGIGLAIGSHFSHAGSSASEIEAAQKNQDEAFRQFSKTLTKDPKAAHRQLEAAEAEVDQAYQRSIKRQKQESEGAGNPGGSGSAGRSYRASGEGSDSSRQSGGLNPSLGGSNSQGSPDDALDSTRNRRRSTSDDAALSSENIPKRIDYPAKNSAKNRGQIPGQIPAQGPVKDAKNREIPRKLGQ